MEVHEGWAVSDFGKQQSRNVREVMHKGQATSAEYRKSDRIIVGALLPCS